MKVNRRRGSLDKKVIICNWNMSKKNTPKTRMEKLLAGYQKKKLDAADSAKQNVIKNKLSKCLHLLYSLFFNYIEDVSPPVHSLIH